MSFSALISQPFYGTAGTALIGLLITWLVAEARAARDERVDGEVRVVTWLAVAGIIGIALVLAAGALVVLLVEYQGHRSSAETVAIWASLGMGFVGVTLSVTRNVAVIARGGSGIAAFRLVTQYKYVAAVVAAAIFGVLASPLVRKETVSVGARFTVYGTCISGGCGLKQRTGPGPSFPEISSHRLLADGTMVRVICQAKGVPPKGFRDPVWDQLPTGTFVSDVFVKTFNRHGGFSSGFDRCPARQTGGAG
jgi:hypothetical protein